MPFERKTVIMYREEFVKRCLANEKSKSALCREYNISRPTGDKWINRYLAGEPLSDKSKAPFHTPNKTASSIEELIVKTRLSEPAIGAVKIHRMLQNKGYSDIPCASTINAVLKRNNLISKEASMAATPNKRFEKAAPNIMWQADFKGNYLLQDGVRCHPLSVIDDHSRYCICADAKTNERLTDTKASFIKSFIEHGLPDILLCDNGNPWGNSQTTGYTKFEIWLAELGILTIHIRAKHPQTQGKVERFNGSFKQERLKFYTPQNMTDAMRQRLEYRDFYNNERPHHALNLDTPSKHYKTSQKAYTSIVREWDYGIGVTLAKIKSTGYLTFKNQGYFLSEALGGKSVALKPSSTDGHVNVYFRQYRIARINIKERSVVSRKMYLCENDPRCNQENIYI